ncbi:MAG: TetR/AcrR family transcriptional regulator [Pseudomonadota bacterium]
MRDERRAQRRDQIEAAAYRVLERAGYGGATMAEIAREARASHETLYRWYGDKAGLFRALVVRNAEEVRASLEDAGEHDPIATLSQTGPRLLALLTGERAVSLNRAAAADRTGELGGVLAEYGRDTVMPLIARSLEAARASGQIDFDESASAADLFVTLLVGDLQIRRVIGRMGPLDREECHARADRALSQLLKLLSPD